MRGLLLGAALTLLAYPSLAGSIEAIKTGTPDEGGSFLTIRCPDCRDEEEKKTSDYVVPELAPGTQRVEILDNDGRKELIRTEAWSGGSPVRRVSVTQVPLFEKDMEAKANTEDELNAPEGAGSDMADERAPLPSPGIDREATTAAVKAGAEGGPDFDLKGLSLRLN